jgi:hypothetical protein
LESLQDALIDRGDKLHAQMQSLQDCIESAIGSHIHDVHVTWQLLKDSLLSETLYDLEQGGGHGTINDLEKEVEAVKRRLAEVKLGNLSEKNAKREKLVERWARQH